MHFLDHIFPDFLFLVQNGISEHHHRIQDIQINLIISYKIYGQKKENQVKMKKIRNL